MSGTFNFKTPTNNPIPTIGDNPNLGSVGNSIGSAAMDDLKRDSQILKLSELEVGEPFGGIVYVVNTQTYPNRVDKSKYDITFYCVDGDGKMFTARLWRSDTKIEHVATPMLIKDAVVVMGGESKIYYNLLKVERYTKPIPLSIFLKEIHNINQVKTRLSDIINNLKDQNYKQIINMVETSGYRSILFETTHKAELGTQLGKTAEIIISIYDSLLSINTLAPIDIELTFTALYCNLFKYKISQKNLVPENNYMRLYPIHPLVSKAIDSAPMEEKKKVKLLSIVMGDNKTREGKLLFDLLDTVEAHIRTSENLKTIRDGESSYGIYNI